MANGLSREARPSHVFKSARTALQGYDFAGLHAPQKHQLRFKSVATRLSRAFPYCWSVTRSYPSRPQMLVIGGISVTGWAAASPTHRQNSAHAQTKLVFIFLFHSTEGYSTAVTSCYVHSPAFCDLRLFVSTPNSFFLHTLIIFIVNLRNRFTIACVILP